MSVEQRVKVSCDHFDCDVAIHSGVGLADARTMTSDAGWVNTLHHIGMTSRVVLQDFCPAHRGDGFDWQTFRAAEQDRESSSLVPLDIPESGGIGEGSDA